MARAPNMPLRAPLVIVLVAKARDSRTVSLFEQQLTAGGAVMAMQMAAVAQCYSGIWRSSWPMFDANLARALGLAAEDRIASFLYLGAPVRAPAAPAAVSPAPFTRHL
ncbi:nitroreductase family protein [Xanthobacter sediminis]|uniref:nitroreductase family protein n=1 Tax=Xanthobacter sediminis TaxID=3119926 RepID=UPI0037263358